MKKLLAAILIVVLVFSFASCSKNKNINSGDAKAILLPEKSTILTEEEGSSFIEVDMTYEEAVKFYEEAVKALEAEGTVDDMGSPGELWAFTGTYGEDDSLILSITVAPSEEGACKVSLHY